MKTSVSLSKISPPYVTKILPRPRLYLLLNEHRNKTLILIVGQAAQGKSTLIASYIEIERIPAVWINLEPDDSEASRLFDLLSRSLHRTLGEMDFSSHAATPLEILGQGLTSGHYQDWAQSIFASIADDVWIVLDNLDRLPPDASALSFLQTLIKESPSQIHWILISRGFPDEPIEFQRLKVNQKALVVTNQDLALTLEEIKDFFHKTQKIPLSTKQAQKIFNATEGWMGGLILLSEMMNRYPESSVEEFLSRHLPDRFNSEIFQYFGREIFSSEPEDVQRFLVRASVLDLMEPLLTDELFEMEKTGDILRDHVRRNLFVESFYEEGKSWIFRFHNLFRGFLKAKFETTVGQEERRRLYLKVAGLYEKRNEFEQAATLYLEAGVYPRVIAIIERDGMDLLRSGRGSLLSGWISKLPEETFRDNPWFLLLLPMLRHFRMGREDLLSLDRARQRFKETGNTLGHMISLAQILIVSVSTGTHLVPIKSLMEEGDRLLQSVEIHDHPYEEATLSYCLGAGYILGHGDIRKGIALCRNGYLLSKRLGDASLRVSALNFEALGYIYVGDFDAAEKKLWLAETLLGKRAHPELKTIHLIICCVLANRRGQFQESRHLLNALEVEIEKYGFVRLHPWIYEISAYLELAHGRLLEAEKLADEYLNSVHSFQNTFQKGLGLRLQGKILLHQNRFEKAKEVLDRALEIFSKEAPFPYEMNRVRLLKALVDSHLNADASSEKACEEALGYFRAILDYPSLAEGHFIMSLIQFNKKRKDKTILHLREGFKIAEEKKYVYFRILGYPYLARICMMSLNLEVAGAIDYASHLLSTRLSMWVGKDLDDLSNHRSPAIREKARQIRRSIHLSQVPRLRIETLGGLKIYRGDSLIEEKEWDRRQPRQLLMSLLAHKGSRAPKDTLIDDLWPDEKPGVAEKDFKTVLQRLRKSLEPALHKDFGSSYIHLHDGYVSLDPETCDIDVDHFFSLFKKAEAENERREVRKAVPIYQAAVELYKGDFLPEEIHLPLVDMKREEIRAKYIELLIKLAQLHEKQGALRKAIECHKKAIQADPLLEESYQRLMFLYSNKRMYNEALKTYEACRKALKAGLKTEPDSVTTALYKKIMEHVNKNNAAGRR